MNALGDKTHAVFDTLPLSVRNSKETPLQGFSTGAADAFKVIAKRISVDLNGLNNMLFFHRLLQRNANHNIALERTGINDFRLYWLLQGLHAQINRGLHCFIIREEKRNQYTLNHCVI